MESQDCFNVSYCTDPKFKLNVIKDPTANEKCYICLRDESNPVQYGEFVVKQTPGQGKLSCHYFCLLSGTNIPQRGSDKTGIAGFRTQDIIEGSLKARGNKCAYCDKSSAAIRCAEAGCDRWFHYICGYNNSCVTHFVGAFHSYCDQHLPDLQRKSRNTKDRECEICFSLLPQETDVNYNPVSIIDCGNDEHCSAGMVHRHCLQKYAYASGYDFRCPLCLNKDFKSYAQLCGIFVPQRKASWEREPQAFKDLHKRKCSAENCSLKNTRDEQNVSKMVSCHCCGGQLMHKVCTGLKDCDQYFCSDCIGQSFLKIL